jgi:Domain of unknown function (DUF6285)
MRDAPDGPTLLALAQQAKRRGEDPALVGRAISIATREAAAGDAPVEAIRARLARLYGPGSLETLLARLAQDIRAGVFDAPAADRETVRLLLWEMTVAKLKESNPEYLAAALKDRPQRQ